RDSQIKVMAYKPAPVQVFWLGFPFTTGLPEVDYILTDDRARPTNPDWLSEEPLTMPESWVCFGSLSPVPISETLPFERNGCITFGTMNKPYKYTRKTVALWSEVMQRVPGSRFLVVRPEVGSMVLVENLTKEFERNGIERTRLYFVDNRGQNLT